MIPKIIHYSWFSGDPYPASIQLYMQTWKKWLPDYEFVLWDMDKAKRKIDSTFMQEALAERKWAFASDVVRCFAVYKYGGIWLDTDVEVLQSFDRFLDYKMFIGREGSSTYQADEDGRHVNTLGSHCFGAVAGHPYLARCLEYYKDRHFLLSHDVTLPESLRYDMKMLPIIQSVIAYREFGYDGSVWLSDQIEDTTGGIHVEPSWVFENPKYKPTSLAVCVHHVFGAWSPQNSGRDYNQDGLFVQPKKNLFYYGFAFLNKILRRRGYLLRVLSVGRPH